jgi:hypothetical protein
MTAIKPRVNVLVNPGDYGQTPRPGGWATVPVNPPPASNLQLQGFSSLSQRNAVDNSH